MSCFPQIPDNLSTPHEQPGLWNVGKPPLATGEGLQGYMRGVYSDICILYFKDGFIIRSYCIGGHSSYEEEHGTITHHMSLSTLSNYNKSND